MSPSQDATSDSSALFGQSMTYRVATYQDGTFDCSYSPHGDHGNYNHRQDHHKSGEYSEYESSFDSRSDSGGSNDRQAYRDERDDYKYARSDYGHCGSETVSNTCSNGSDERDDIEDTYGEALGDYDGNSDCEEA